MQYPGESVIALRQSYLIRRDYAELTATPAAAPRVVAVTSSHSVAWIVAFILFQSACSFALLTSAVGPLRPLMRTASFGASLLLLFFLRGHGQAHPASRAACWIMVILGLSLFHPTTNTWVSALAQATLYLAILAPLFWVPRLRIDGAGVRKIFLVLWILQSASALVGVLQVCFPGHFQPNLSSFWAERDADYLKSLTITTASGAHLFRPMGLTDTPGGAATSGFYAVLFGLGLFLTARSFFFRVACTISMFLGMAALYLSHVRSILIMLCVCLLAFLALLVWRGEGRKLSRLLVVLIVTGALSFSWAVALGGEGVTSRLGTLLSKPPEDVYYSNRGRFLEHTVNDLLPEYPLGAGLGRWGMINYYFGDKTNPETAPIWVEIQWTGWLLDGGLPLIVAYVVALLLAFGVAWRVAMRRDPEGLWLWGAVLIAYNLGALAITFNYPFFIGQGGLELWLLNAALFAATQNVRCALLSPEQLAPCSLTSS
jgi:hypothetical protein